MKFFGNVTKLEAEISSADKLIQADIEAANITTAMRDGKTIPISEATLTEKYAALRQAQPVGSNLEERAQLLSSNAQIATRLEKAETDLALEKTNVGTLTRENALLKQERDTAQASVKTLTEEKSNQINLRDAAVKENSRLQGELDAINAEISKRALSYGVLNVEGNDEAAKLAEANKKSPLEKLTLIDGALNSAAARIGVKLGEVPNAGATNQATAKPKTELKGLDRTKAAFEEQTAKLFGRK